MNKSLKFDIQETKYKLVNDKHQQMQKEKENRDPGLRCSQLNLNILKSNIDYPNPKSDRTPSKLNYRYERVNNSFRLVQVDQIEPTEAEETNRSAKMTNNTINQSLGCKKIDKNTQILLTLNSLNERIQKLQRTQKFEDQKQQFNIHKMIQKVIYEQNINSISKNYHPFDKKIQNLYSQINEMKQNIKSLSIIPNYIADSELHVIRKCKLNLNERIDDIKKQIIAQVSLNIKQQIDKSFLQNNIMEEKLYKIIEQHQFKQTKKLEQKISDLLSGQKHVLNHYQKQKQKIQKIHQSICESQRNSLKTQKCTKQIIGNILLQYSLKNINNYHSSQFLQSSSLLSVDNSPAKLRTLVYGVDPDGFIVDQNGYYILNKENVALKIDPKYMKILQTSQFIQENIQLAKIH